MEDELMSEDERIETCSKEERLCKVQYMFGVLLIWLLVGTAGMWGH